MVFVSKVSVNQAKREKVSEIFRVRFKTEMLTKPIETIIYLHASSFRMKIKRKVKSRNYISENVYRSLEFRNPGYRNKHTYK